MSSTTTVARRRVLTLLLAAAFAVALSTGVTEAHADTTHSDDHDPEVLSCCGWPPG